MVCSNYYINEKKKIMAPLPRTMHRSYKTYYQAVDNLLVIQTYQLSKLYIWTNYCQIMDTADGTDHIIRHNMHTLN